MKKTFKILLLAIVATTFLGSTTIESNTPKNHNSFSNKLTVNAIDWWIDNSTDLNPDFAATSNSGMQALIVPYQTVNANNFASGYGEYDDAVTLDIEVVVSNYRVGTYTVDVYEDNSLFGTFSITGNGSFTHSVNTSAIGSLGLKMY